jgi:Tfp pilus assembly PilM family ATPase
MKIEQGFESDSKEVVQNILEPTFNSIIEQAQKNLGEFDEFKTENIDKLILSGGTSELKGAKEYIQNKIKTEVVYGNPWAKIEYPKEIEKKILATSPFFGVAVGLALIGLED